MPDPLDNDLRSIQEARQLATACREAQRAFMSTTQEQVDRICAAMADAAFKAAAQLGQMAHDETGYGVAAHKKLKNEFAARTVWDSLRDVKTVGVIRRDERHKVTEIGWPMGVVAALTPSTNPTSTVIYKVLIAVKARNGIVVAPHPSAVRCCVETARVMAEAGEAAGMPRGLVACMQHISLPGTDELMKHRAVAVILATGGSAMVKAAHSAGKPAYGVGPGNVPCYVDRSADIKQAAYYLVSSKAFDHSVICATEQAVVADKPVAAQLAREMESWGAYFVDSAQADALAQVLFYADGAINAKSVGLSPQRLAQMAGIQVPDRARILVARLQGVGKEYPLSREKLTTVLGFYEAEGWEKGCECCIELLNFGGRGHSLVLHARDEKVISEFGLEKPAFRILVNTMGTLGSIGLTTGLMPAMTLATGGIGGSVSGDNITVTHLMNIKRVAYETTPPPAAALIPSAPAAKPVASQTVSSGPISDHDIDEIVHRVMRELGR